MSDALSARSSPVLLTLTAQIVAAYVTKIAVAPDALPALIASVYDALFNAGKTPDLWAERPQPAVPVKKSVQQDHLVCLEDGVKVTMLKRYLAKRFSLAPAQYRERWGLPSNYPMVAPAYAARRSTLAKESGLGRRAVAAPVSVKAASRKAGRPKVSKAKVATPAE